MNRYSKQCFPLLLGSLATLYSPLGESNEPGSRPGRSEAALTEQLSGWSPHPTGFNPFRRNTRSPSGLFYLNPWQPPESTPIGDGGWTLRGAFDAGLIGSSDDRDVASFSEYGDWDEGLTLHRFWYLFEQPETGAWFEGSGGAIGRDDQHFRVSGGKYGRYEIAGFLNTTPHRFSSNARVLWNGAGSGQLTLPAGLLAGSSTAGQIETAFGSVGRSTLELEREKFGVSFRVTPSHLLEVFGRVSTEARDGTRAFGGTFSYPGLGQVMELVEPINYTTTDLSAGVRFSGPQHQFNVMYSGSHFRNDTQSLTWENPGLSLFPMFAPPSGRYALAPDNDYQNLKLDYGTDLAFWRTRITATASLSQARQDEALLPPTIGLGIVNAAGMPIDLDLWNSTAALSRTNADAAIDHLLGNVRIVMQPTRKLRLTGELRYLDQDNKTDYTALNPLTGQYGYIALDGGLAGIIPTRSAVFDPDLPGSRVRIRNAPYEKDESSAEIAADYRASSATKFGLSVRREELDYSYRERTSVTDDIVRFELTQRGIPRGSLRIGYEWLRRDGSDYISNPYEAIYSSSLPG
ncbi:MAG TPA: MtrB/PioB family outer membrane beta-barrel protein, partial [Gammaproteobacteria bacterium]